jgi:hypothetical protein
VDGKWWMMQLKFVLRNIPEPEYIYIIQLKFLENGWRETQKNTTH